MRIGIDATYLSAEARYTGMGVYTLGLLRGLVNESGGHQVQALGYGARPPDLPAPIEWHRIPALRVGKAGPWLSHQLSLPALTRRLRLDVLHIPGVNVRLSRPGVPMFSTCPMVVTAHDAIPLTFYERNGAPLPWKLRLAYRISARAVRRADAVITVSETSRRDVCTALGIPEERIRLVYNGLPELPVVTATEAEAVTKGLGVLPPFLFYAGSYEPRKNLIGTIRAYDRAARDHPLPPLVVLTEAESGHKAAVLAEASKVSTARQIIWLHSLNDLELASLYSMARIFVYPSFYEGFGFTPLQALRAGVPTIASNTGAIPEVLGEAAMLVDPGSVDAIAAALVTLMRDGALRAAYAAAGPLQANRFDWRRAARETLAVYEEVSRDRKIAGQVAAKSSTEEC